ncbi:MAG TPA: hypothetical protein PK542_01265, partial [Treponemataceae bacterium]|nr:hypothetical protein [Treponemataceae bacterium]
LFGKPLIKDDFAIIVNSRLYPAFPKQEEIQKKFPDVIVVEKNKFYSTVDPNIPPRADLQTTEYINKNLRFVFFHGIFSDIRDGRCGFTSIMQKASTVRGIMINDPITKVFSAYGTDDWINSHKEMWYKGFLGFDYRLYYTTVINNKEEEIYDSIEFEIKDGVVVGIYFNYMNSD